MRYFHCLDCDGLMDEYEAYCTKPEIHYELENRPIEWIGWWQCIYCNSEDLEEAAECEECGEMFPENMLDENGLCADCRAKAEKEETD